MKVYVAAPYPLRDEAIRVMEYLESCGYVVTSRWLREVDLCEMSAASKCLQDIINAQTLLLINPAEWDDQGTGGRHVELGYALAFGKQVIILGERTNNFHYLSTVRVVGRIEDL